MMTLQGLWVGKKVFFASRLGDRTWRQRVQLNLSYVKAQRPVHSRDGSKLGQSRKTVRRA